MKHFLCFLIFLPFFSPAQNSDTLIVLPGRNQQVIDTVLKYGPSISPTYETAVCTELVIGILGHFFELTREDKINVRIHLDEGLDVYKLIAEGSPLPKGVYHALTSNGRGEPIDDLHDALPGDFVQFWYYRSWGHCGILHHIDFERNLIFLYSSYPSTGGYGIQHFVLPEYCHVVRLK
jgi:hypothetical protein